MLKKKVVFTYSKHFSLQVEPFHFAISSLYFSEENTISNHVTIMFIKSFIILNRLDLTLSAHVRSKKPQTHVHGSSFVQGSWSFNKLPIRPEGSSVYPHLQTHESDCREPQYPSQWWEPYSATGIGHLWRPSNGKKDTFLCELAL